MESCEWKCALAKLERSQSRSTIVRAGLYLTAFELLHHDVVEKTQGFFLQGFTSDGWTYSPRCYAKVTPLDRNLFDASAKWLAKAGAWTAVGCGEVIEIRRHRNQIAHVLPKLLIDPGAHLSTWMLERCRFYIGVLGRFWGAIEVDTDRRFDGVEVDYQVDVRAFHRAYLDCSTRSRIVAT